MSRPIAAESVQYDEAKVASPDGQVHVFDAGSPTTLCGLPLRKMHTREFADVAFEGLSADLQCAGCIEGGALAPS